MPKKLGMIRKEWMDSVRVSWIDRVLVLSTVIPIGVVLLQATVIAHAAAQLGRLPIPGIRLGFHRGLLGEYVDPGPESLGFRGVVVQAIAVIALLVAPIGLFSSAVQLCRAFASRVDRAASGLRVAAFAASWVGAIYLNISGAVEAFSWFWT